MYFLTIHNFAVTTPPHILHFSNIHRLWIIGSVQALRSYDPQLYCGSTWLYVVISDMTRPRCVQEYQRSDQLATSLKENTIRPGFEQHTYTGVTNKLIRPVG